MKKQLIIAFLLGVSVIPVLDYFSEYIEDNIWAYKCHKCDEDDEDDY